MVNDDEPAGTPATAAARRQVASLPGPAGLPWIGNLLQMDRAQPHVAFREWGKAYGPIFRFQLAGKLFVGVTDHAAIQQLLRDRPGRVRRMRSIQEIIDEIGGTGLFSAEGESWRRQRRLTAPAFNVGNLKLCFPQVKTVTDRLLRVFERRAEAAEPFEIQHDLMRYAVDVTTWLALDRDVNTLETETEEFQRDIEEVFPAIGRRINAPIPYWRYIQLGRDRRLARALTRLRARVHALVAAQRSGKDGSQPDSTRSGSLLGALVEASDDAESPLSEDEIFGNIITILTAGEDTTAYSLAWAIYFIATAPAVQERLREEALAVMGEQRVVGDFEQLERFEYFEAVALEAMRLRPVAPVLFLEANEDLVILDTFVPKGLNILVLTAFDALQEENFTCSREFRPERWIEGERPPSWNHNLRAFMPFGGGARVCPGRSLAMAEIKTVLSMICRTFHVSRDVAAGPVRELFAFTIGPANLQIELRPR